MRSGGVCRFDGRRRIQWFVRLVVGVMDRVVSFLLLLLVVVVACCAGACGCGAGACGCACCSTIMHATKFQGQGLPRRGGITMRPWSHHGMSGTRNASGNGLDGLPFHVGQGWFIRGPTRPGGGGGGPSRIRSSIVVVVVVVVSIIFMSCFRQQQQLGVSNPLTQTMQGGECLGLFALHRGIVERGPDQGQTHGRQ